MIEKLSSVDVIKDEENPLRRLEGIVQGYQEWMVGTEQYLSLLYGVMKQVLVKECFLLQHLKGIKLSMSSVCWPLPNQIDFGVRTPTDDFNYVEIFKLYFLRVETLHGFQVFFVIRLISAAAILLDLLNQVSHHNFATFSSARNCGRCSAGRGYAPQIVDIGSLH